MSKTVVKACAEVAQQRPDWPPPDQEFEHLLEQRASEATGLDDVHVHDLFVAHRALRGDGRALAVLDELLDKLRPALRRTGAPPELVLELIRELPGELVTPRAEAPPRLAAYTGRGALAAWLRVVAVRRLVEERRREGARPALLEVQSLDRLADSALDPELRVMRQRYLTELRDAVRASVTALPPADRLWLRQHHVDGLSIDRLAALHGIHRATAARRLARIRDDLAADVRGRLVSSLGVGTATLDSIVRLVGSELTLGLDPYL